MTVVCAGLLTVDVVQVIDRLPRPDEKTVGREQRLDLGGPATNAARTVAALGMPVRLLACFGASPLTDFARATLARDAVEWVDPVAAQANPAPVSTVLVTQETGDRAVVSGGGPQVPGDWGCGDVLAGAAVLLIDGHGGDLPARAAAEARRLGMSVLLDGGSYKPGMEAYLRHVDLALLSADFAAPDAADACAWARSHGARAAAQSAGPRPIRLVSQAGDRQIPVPRVSRVIDTNGAGDVLHGAAAVAMAGHGVADPAAVLAYAAHIASRSVAYAGALGWAHAPG
mgnify:FL=1